MNFIHATFPGEKAYCLPVGDIHFGDKAFAKEGREKLQGNLEWVRERADHAFIVLMGDVFNIAGREEKTSPFETNPREIEEATDFFTPYAPYIRGAITGNHEFRVINRYGFDPMSLFCKMLNIPYLGICAQVRIQVGKRPEYESYWNTYNMMVHHTTGGGGTLGNALNAVAKLERIATGMDIYAGGHNHQLVTGTQQRYFPTYTGPVLKKVHFVSCGSYLDYPESYAERYAMSPGKLGSPRLRFSGVRDRHDIHISL